MSFNPYNYQAQPQQDDYFNSSLGDLYAQYGGGSPYQMQPGNQSDPFNSQLANLQGQGAANGYGMYGNDPFNSQLASMQGDLPAPTYGDQGGGDGGSLPFGVGYPDPNLSHTMDTSGQPGDTGAGPDQSWSDALTMARDSSGVFGNPNLAYLTPSSQNLPDANGQSSGSASPVPGGPVSGPFPSPNAPGTNPMSNPNQGVQPPPPPTPASGSPYPGANQNNSNYQFQQGVDYSQPGAIDYTQFQGNAYAKANANRLPAELDPNTSLQGGIDPNKYATLKSQYGYQMAQNGIADYNQAEQMLYAAGRQDPGSDYYLVDVAGGGYAILKRARTAQGQIDAGFTPPSMRPVQPPPPPRSGNGFSRSTGGSGGGGNVPLAPNGKPYANPSSFTGIPEGYPAQGTGAMGLAGMMGPNHRDPNTGQVSPNYPNYQAKDGDTRYNLQTGQQEVYQNGQWVVKPQGGGGGGHLTPMTR